MMYLDCIIFKIHLLFNEYKKVKVAYKCDHNEYQFTKFVKTE